MRTLLMTFTTILAASCASPPQAKPVEIDPSNPAAAEAPRPTVPDLIPAPSAPAAAAPTAAPSTPPKAVYTCPMHPEVLSDKPGRCPKCGMNLVKKSGDPAPDERK